MISSLVINCPEFNESLLFPQISFSGYICYIIYCDYTWLLKLLTERFSHPLEWLPHSDICELVTVGKCWSRSNSLERSDNYASDVCTSYSDGSKSAQEEGWAQEQTQACFCPTLLNSNESDVTSHVSFYHIVS